jgi:hypothetical protein
VDPANGESIWNQYLEDGDTTDSRWGIVTQYAEGIQAETDVYSGYPNYPIGIDPFKNRTRSEIRTLLSKPSAPMVYTGGIALAGFSTGSGQDNAGLIKLGHESKPVAYIRTNPVSGWGRDKFLVAPVSVTGTTTCPYAGMSLAIDGKQELDGTMHLVLARTNDVAGVTKKYTTITSYSNISANADIEMGGQDKGKLYRIDSTSTGITATLIPNNTLDDGDEFIVVVGSKATVNVKYAAQITSDSELTTLPNNHSYLLRKVMVDNNARVIITQMA